MKNLSAHGFPKINVNDTKNKVKMTSFSLNIYLKNRFSMKRYGIIIALLVSLIFLTRNSFAQVQGKKLLAVEDFANTNSIFTLNASGSSGNNKWVINQEYDGGGKFPNTPSQTITLGNIGKIGSPDENYLHIHSSLDVPKNTNFNPSNSSDSWVRTKGGYCTLGYTEILMTFWWLAGGSDNAYGEVYYSIDGGGSWKLASNTDGRSRYNYSNTWQYSVIKMPEFVNQFNLQFAFRWYNAATSTQDTMSFAVDDVFLVANAGMSPPTVLTAVSVAPETGSLPFCQEDKRGMIFTFSSSDSLCADLLYQIEISDANGSFNNPTIMNPLLTTPTPLLPNVNYTSPTGLGYYFHTNLPFGSCYRWRIKLITPPFSTSVESSCFPIGDCTDSITTLQPAVTLNPPENHVCMCSDIDVPFQSYGAFNPSNAYILELSDSSGSFSNPRIIGGPKRDSRTWDPALPYLPPPPGSMSGQIPTDIPPGCNYYVRVNSSDPVVEGKPWGPFCITQCDIKTDSCQDISVCISESAGATVTIPIDIHQFNSLTTYGSNNKFAVQIIDPTIPDKGGVMAVLKQDSLGVLGTLTKNSSGQLVLKIPPLGIWTSWGLKPQMYYLRVIATNSSNPNDVKSTIIRLTVTAVKGTKLDFVCDNCPICVKEEQTGMTLRLTTPGLLQSSGYIWVFMKIDTINGVPVFSPPLRTGTVPFNPVNINLDNFQTGTYGVTVIEVGGGNPNLNCLGPVSDTILITIDGPPYLKVNGPAGVCLGDTVTYSCPFESGVYYEWEWPRALVDTLVVSNNEITVIWKNYGSGNFKIWGLGKCGDGEDSKIITVYPKTKAVVDILPNDSVCLGDVVNLQAHNTNPTVGGLGMDTYIWTTTGFDTLGVDSVLSLTPDSTTIYTAIVSFFGCEDKSSVKINIKPSALALDSNYISCKGDSLQLYAGEGTSFRWVPAKGLSSDTIINPNLQANDSTTYTVYVSYKNGCKADTGKVKVKVKPVVQCVAGPDVTIIKGQSITLSGCTSDSVIWSPGYGLSDSTKSYPTASPDSTITYTIRSTKNGCETMDEVTVRVIEAPKIVVPSAFSPNGDGENDIFYAIGIGMEDKLLEFKIFNRWGEVVFKTDDILVGWDGNYSGKPQEIGTYVYYIKAKTINNEEKTLQGSVTLIK